MELELVDEVVARLVEGGRTRHVAVSDRVALTPDRLVVHQGCGRAAPPGVRDAMRRLELDDATLTWGVGAGHCQVWVEAGVGVVRDCGSDNGTFIERSGESTRIAGGEQLQLREGDVLRVARVTLRVRS